MSNAGTGRALYRSLFAELLEPLFGMRLPTLRREGTAGAAGDLERFAAVYAWPDRRVAVEVDERPNVLYSMIWGLPRLPPTAASPARVRAAMATFPLRS
jgi:hypothetical protein